MSDSPQYEAFRAFARSEIRAARLELKAELAKELKDDFKEILTREAPKVIEVASGKDGKDGVGISDISIREGTLVTRLSDGTERILGRVVGEKGDPGKDGEHGKGLPGKDGENGKDSTVPGPKGDPGEHGADGIATRAELDELVEQRFGELQVRTFADTYQGVYEPNRTYTRGLLTTWGGSLWLSQSDTKTKPGESPDWKLVVKKGADGRK